jgi:hypothetical protein
MSKCEFVYETLPGPFFDYSEVGRQATLRCKTHNCTIMGTSAITLTEDAVCLYGRIEALEERVAQLERPQRSTEIDELGNPYSLRIPVKDE